MQWNARPEANKFRKMSRSTKQYLIQIYDNQTDKPSAEFLEKLSRELNIPPKKIRIWLVIHMKLFLIAHHTRFQNRRARQKLASGSPGTECPPNGSADEPDESAMTFDKGYFTTQLSEPLPATFDPLFPMTTSPQRPPFQTQERPHQTDPYAYNQPLFPTQATIQPSRTAHVLPPVTSTRDRLPSIHALLEDVRAQDLSRRQSNQDSHFRLYY